MKKDYNLWFPQKKRLDKVKTARRFNVREVWWCSIGINIGYEIFGKGASFTRPVLILKKYGGSTFLGAPLTSAKVRFPDLQIPITIDGRVSTIRLDQIRTYDARRLQQKRIYRMSEAQFGQVILLLKNGF